MSARPRLILDLGMFAALIVTLNPVGTGITIHECRVVTTRLAVTKV